MPAFLLLDMQRLAAEGAPPSDVEVVDLEASPSQGTPKARDKGKQATQGGSSMSCGVKCKDHVEKLLVSSMKASLSERKQVRVTGASHSAEGASLLALPPAE